MNKTVYVCCLFLMSLSLVSALDTDVKASYAQGETLITEIYGPILEPITNDNVEFLRGHVSVVFEYDLKRLGDQYFLYAITPFAMNNYTLVLRDVATLVNGQRTLVTYERNFSTTNETIPYTVKPGLVYATSDFELYLTLNQDHAETITVTHNGNTSVVLQPGVNTLDFDIDTFSTGLTTLQVGSYELPVYNALPPTINEPPRIIEIDPLRIEYVFFDDEEDVVVTFIIRNTGPETLTNVDFNYDDDKYTLTPKRIKSLKVNESLAVNLTFEEQVDIQDTISFVWGNETFEIPVSISYRDEPLNITNQTILPNGTVVDGFYCRELNGRICTANELCSGELLNALDGLCCRGTCTLAEEDQTSLAWVGYLIGGIIVIIGVVIGARYLKSRSPKKSSVLDKEVKKLERPF